MGKAWFVTGASRGLGKAFVLAALSRGDCVAATARNIDSLVSLSAEYPAALLPLELDVTDKVRVNDVVGAAVDRFGRLDIVVNNAGYGQFGAVEELNAAELREQLETNFLGTVWVTQAVLPLMRAQSSGHIIQVSSIGGVVAFPGLGAYHASKWAVEGLSESLAMEVRSFGIHVTIVEPGAFATDWGGSSARHAAPLALYAPLREARAAAGSAGATGGDPSAAAQALLKLTDSADPPLRLLLGEMPTLLVRDVYSRRLQVWADWEGVSREVDDAPAS